MWLLDRLHRLRAASCVILLGQAQCQLWVHSDAGLVLKDALPCGDLSLSQVHGLGEIVARLLAEAPPHANVQVLVDAKWMPVSWLHLGDALLDKAQMEALLQHRFADVYSDGARHWSYRSTYVQGDAWTWAAGLPDQLLSALSTAFQTAPSEINTKGGWRLAGIESSFTWGWRRTRKHMGRGGDRCWAWVEQDRTQLAVINKGRLLALNVAAPHIHEVVDLQAFLRIHCWRAGVASPPDQCTIVTWKPLTNQAAFSRGGAEVVVMGNTAGGAA